MQCINHPDRLAGLACMKDGTGFCEDCQTCRNIGRYCEFRTGCEIWYSMKDREKGEGVVRFFNRLKDSATLL